MALLGAALLNNITPKTSWAQKWCICTPGGGSTLRCAKSAIENSVTWYICSR